MIYAGWLLCYSEPPRNIPVVRELSLAAFLVYRAAVLFYKPIVAAELICQKIDGLICHGQPN